MNINLKKMKKSRCLLTEQISTLLRARSDSMSITSGCLNCSAKKAVLSARFITLRLSKIRNIRRSGHWSIGSTTTAFTMVTKPTKEFTDSLGRRKIKGDMDIELAIDMLEMAPHLDHVILFSGDGDFRRLIEVVQRKGVRVSVVSTVKSNPPMIADELRRQADDFIELQDLAKEISRAHQPHPESAEDNGLDDDFYEEYDDDPIVETV